MTTPEVTRLAEELAAIGQVGAVATGDGPPAAVFESVTAHVGELIGADAAAIVRVETPSEVSCLGFWTRAGGFQTFPRRCRCEPGDFMRAHGWPRSVGAPVVLEGRIWGVLAVASTTEDTLPEDTEERLAKFSELVGTAVSNAMRGEQLTVLAREQASLRRVATLVAGESSPAELFEAVTREAAQVLETEAVGMLRFEADGSATLIAQSDTPWDPPPLGTRFTLEGQNVIAEVHRTGRTTRFDSWADSTGSVAAMAHVFGIRSSVAAPVVVEGRLWGALIAATTASERLPSNTETRIEQFTELVATVIAGAEARSALSRLADEQAALRRVATLVAEGATPSQVFDAVRAEVEQMFGILNTIVMRFDADDTATLLATPGEYIGPIGTRWSLEGDDSAVARVYHTGRAARADYTAGTCGPLAEAARLGGTRFPVAVPVVVDGALWGAMSVGSLEPEPPPPDLEDRLAKFTELLATAIANTETRSELQRLADEQAGLRRVATLVAGGAAPTEVFEAVVDEVGQMLGAAQVGLARYHGEHEISVLAIRGQDPEVVRAGMRLPLDGDSVNARILRTGRSARLNFSEEGSGTIARVLRQNDVNATVGAPIMVDGALWGMIGASWRGQNPPPADAEKRLAQFAELLDMAIANADSRDQLIASRARVLTEGDEARRRVVRDLHDGAQQRLVHAIVTLKLAQRALRDDPRRAESLVAEALAHAQRGNAELRELSHGILPSVLTRGGLRAGIDAVVSRLEIPVDVNVTPERVTREIEASAYFIVLEALTNVVKHSRATRAEVTVAVDDDTLIVEVDDNGVGGANPHGHGLVGISDRVAAFGGSLRIESSPGRGTEVAARLPLAV